jgi:glutamine amidotransferase
VTIAILDLGINNINSVVKAFSTFTAEEVLVVQEDTTLEVVSLAVLPGLGHFGVGAARLHETRLDEFITRHAIQGTLIVGICLGMQLLGNRSEEMPGSNGLGLISGGSARLLTHKTEKVPHVGWNSLKLQKHSNLNILESDSDFYFTHSYSFTPDDPRDILTLSSFGDSDFVSSIQKDNILGFQFHPEKSGNAGSELIQQIVRISIK